MLAARRAPVVVIALASVVSACGGADRPKAEPALGLAVAEGRLAIAVYCSKLVGSQNGTRPEPTEAEHEQEIAAIAQLERLLRAGDGNLVLAEGETVREHAEDRMEGLAVGNCDPDGEERLEAALAAG